jgi:hypothetical protein
LIFHFLSPAILGSWNEIYWGGEFENDEREYYFLREFNLPNSGPYFVCTSSNLRRDERLKDLSEDEMSFLEGIGQIIQPHSARGLYVQLSKPDSVSKRQHIEALTAANNDGPSIPSILYPQFVFYKPDIPKLIDMLRQLKYLRHLDLYQFTFDKPLFSDLCSISQLEHLGLPQCSTDVFLESVASLKQLSFLNASGTEVSGKGFHWLTHLGKLETLDLRGTKLDEESLGILKEIKSLKVLLLAYSKVTDKHLKNIGELGGLTSITLHHTAITDDGLRYLSGIKTLAYVSVYDTKTTQEGHKKLLTAIPGIVIDAERPPTHYDSDKFLPFPGYNGDLFAQYWLGKFNSKSAPVDALMWYLLCNEQIGSMSDKFQSEIRNCISTLKAKLHQEQISEAEQKVRAVHQFQRNVKMEFQTKQYHSLPIYQYHFQENK